MFAHGSPCGSRSKTHSRKPIWKSGSSSAMYLLKDQAPQITVKSSPRLPGCRSVPLRYLGRLRSPKIKACCWERIAAPLPPLRPRPECDFIRPRQLSPFPECLVMPFSNEVILSGCEELDSSGNDLFSLWVKLSEHEILVEHMVDIEKATAEFRETSERKHATSSHMNSSSERFAIRTIVQRRLSIYNWNPGPRRGKEDAFEKQIAGRWLIITPQEASEYVDHKLLTNRFHMTHYAVCAILFNKDTVYPNIDVESKNLHDTTRDLPAQVIEGEQGWVIQGVLSRAIFRRQPVSGQKCFTVLSLHTSNIYAKKKGIAKKLILTLRAFLISQEVDLVAGDFNGTAWRHRGKDNLSTIDEAFMDSILPYATGPHTTVGPGSIPDIWADVCGFLKPPGSQLFWKVQ